MRILVLDDDEIRHEQFRDNLKEHSVVHVYTAEEAGEALAKEKFDLVYLDHDLQDFQNNPSGYGVVEQTGMDVARYIARYLAPQKHPSKVIVHSWNVSGGPRMVSVLRDAGISAVYQPFSGQSGKNQAFARPTEVQLTEADDPNWVTVSLGDEPTSLAELKEQIDDQVERMQTPEARDAARSLFTATPEEFGEAALTAAQKRDALFTKWEEELGDEELPSSFLAIESLDPDEDES